VTPEARFITAAIRNFVKDEPSMREFIEINKAILSGLPQDEKRAVWDALKKAGGVA